jgi:alginate O-acetyltransferase complex protein AlgI
MLFNDQVFLFIFLPVVFFLLSFVRKFRQQNDWSLVLFVGCSFFFYGFHNWYHLPLLLGSICFNYFLGILILKGSSKSHQEICLAFGIFINLGVLGVYKYANFFLGSVGITTFLDIALPLAISFFTFQQIAYLVDLKRGLLHQTSFLHYSFFVSFFPQLIAGPIVRAQDILPQLRKKILLSTTNEQFWAGVCLFSIGLFKKTCLADGIKPLAEAVFSFSDHGIVLSIMEAWIGVLAFGLQIYFDFSAYSDMAIGLGLLFGLQLPINFNSPYKATSIIEFWRRWHITLSEFLRDYLYKPLGGNRSGIMKAMLNVMIVMSLGGLWHGADWTFVIWGVFHGFLISLNHLFRAWEKLNFSNFKILRFLCNRTLGWFFTFIFISISWVFFRAENLTEAFEIIASMLGLNGIDLPRFFSFPNQFEFLSFEGAMPNKLIDRELIPLLAVLLGIVRFFPNATQLVRLSPESEVENKSLPSWLIGVCGLLLFFGIKTSFENITHEFIYFRF